MAKSGQAIRSIGARLREARRGRGWPLRAAAKRLGVSVRFLNELERGKATARLDKVLQALGGVGLDLGVRPAREPALREQVLGRKRLLRTIASAHGVRRVSLFGSAARGKTGPQSDLDFLVELDRGRSLLDMLSLKHDLELLFGRKVDVFTAGTLKPRVLASSRRDFVRVF